MIAGMIGVFVMKFGWRGKEAVSQKQSATLQAAQVGNDLPESEKAARQEIADQDRAIRTKLAEQQRLQQKQSAHYPQDVLPFETGKITPKEIDLYQRAKEALKTGLERLNTRKSLDDALPASFDESGVGSEIHGQPQPEQQASAGTDNAAAAIPAADSSRSAVAAASADGQTQTPQDYHMGSVGKAAESAEAPLGAVDAVSGADVSGGMGLSGIAAGQGLGSLANGPPGAGSQMIRNLLMKQGAQSQQDADETWLQKQRKAAGSAPATPIQPGSVPDFTMLQEGAVIPLVLLTALNNTLPGHVSARVTQNVYDSIRGKTLLIPAGTRMEGNYDQNTKFGQRRMMLAFNRLILPTGASIRMAAWTGGDMQGRSGVPGDLDNHLFEQFGTGILLATIGWALEPGNSSSIVLNTTGTSNGSIGTAAGQITANTANGILSNYQNLKPELNVTAGSKLAVIVLQDIEFPASDRKDTH